MVYVFMANGTEEIESLTVVDLLRRVGIDVLTVSITGEKIIKGARGIEIVCDKLLDEIDNDADCLVLPGGMPGTTNLEQCGVLMDMVRTQNEKKKLVAAICAAPTILGHIGLLKKHKACCYPNMEGELDCREVTYSNVTVSDNIITSRGLGTAIDFSLTITELLTNKATSDSLASKIVYNK